MKSFYSVFEEGMGYCGHMHKFRRTANKCKQGIDKDPLSKNTRVTRLVLVDRVIVSGIRCSNIKQG